MTESNIPAMPEIDASTIQAGTLSVDRIPASHLASPQILDVDADVAESGPYAHAVVSAPAVADDLRRAEERLAGSQEPAPAVSTATAPAQPTDRLPSAEARAEAALSEEELIADVQGLKPAHKMRVRERNKVIELMFSMSELQDQFSDVRKADDEEEVARAAAEAAGEEFTAPEDRELDKRRREAQLKMLDFAAVVDEFFEAQLASDPAAYAQWAEGKEHNAFFALLVHYAGFAKN